jgi:hypothetical protein
LKKRVQPQSRDRDVAELIRPMLGSKDLRESPALSHGWNTTAQGRCCLGSLTLKVPTAYKLQGADLDMAAYDVSQVINTLSP